MPTTDRPILFYDNSCGPCTLFASVARALARGRLEIAGLMGPEADRALLGVDPADRYSWMRLHQDGMAFTHTDALVPLVGVVLGKTATKGMNLVRPAEWALRAFYHWLYKVRIGRGCPVPARDDEDDAIVPPHLGASEAGPLEPD